MKKSECINITPVNNLIQQLLTHPPIPLHLVIISRRDPPLKLLSLRSSNQMTEIRMQDLRFDPEESRALLEKIPGFSIDDNTITSLQQEVEGWVVGLQLVSLTLRKLKNRDGFLNNLHGGIQQAQEYLTQEVIAQQSPLMQTWLVQSAILNRFCEPLIQALCADEDSTGTAATDQGKFIEALHADNLFVVPLDNNSEWFRYHHQFQQLLQLELKKRMTPEEIAGLYSRASQWFESQDLIREAIHYALRAGDISGAADIFERHQQAELNLDRWYIVEGWLKMLPAEIIQQRPRLMLIQMWGLYNRYQIQDIPPLLTRVESLLVDHVADKSLLAEVNFYRGLLLTVLQGDAKGALVQFEKGRKHLTGAQLLTIEGTQEIVTAVAHQMVGKGTSASHSLKQRIHAMDSSKGLFIAKLFMARTFIHLLSGELTKAARTARQCTTMCSNSTLPNLGGWSSYLWANACLQSGHLDDALRGFGQAAEKLDILHRKSAIETQVGLVLTYQAMQQPDDAVIAMKQLMAFALDTEQPVHIAVARSCQARLSLLQGDLKSATDWLHSQDEMNNMPGMFMWLEVPLLTQIKVVVATGSHKKLQKVSALLAKLRQATGAIRNTYHMIDILVLQCVVLKKLGRMDEALNILRQVIKLTEPDGWIRPFVELGQPMAILLEHLADQQGDSGYLSFVLGQFPSNKEPPATKVAGLTQATTDSEVWLAEPLTRRELDVLELLAQRLQTKEIAARLFVSPETVKTHLKNLYQKLDVSNRRDASIKAGKIVSRGRATP